MSSGPGEGTIKTQLEYTYYAQYMYTCMQVPYLIDRFFLKMTRTLNLILHISFKNELAMKDGS